MIFLYYYIFSRIRLEHYELLYEFEIFMGFIEFVYYVLLYRVIGA